MSFANLNDIIPVKYLPNHYPTSHNKFVTAQNTLHIFPSSSSDICSICADNILTGEDITFSPDNPNCAKHPFHLKCYKEFIEKRTTTITCPVCNI
jgi:hypothetical protein